MNWNTQLMSKVLWDTPYDEEIHTTIHTSDSMPLHYSGLHHSFACRYHGQAANRVLSTSPSSTAVFSFLSSCCDRTYNRRWRAATNGMEPLSSLEWWGGRDCVMGQIGNLARPREKVIVFQGRRGLQGTAEKQGIRNKMRGRVWAGSNIKSHYLLLFLCHFYHSVPPPSLLPFLVLSQIR